MSAPLDTLRTIARDQGVDAVVVVPGSNFARLFGGHFMQHERPLLVLVPSEGDAAAIVPQLELGPFGALDLPLDVHEWRDQDGYAAAFSAALAGRDLRRIGVEGLLMRVFVDQALRAAVPDVQIVDLQAPLSRVRLHKTADEIAALRRAIACTEQALEETLADVRVGLTESAIEQRLVQALFAAGANELSFAPIVAAGGHSANPHARARDVAIAAGDPLLFDLGGRVDGLCADLTRTVFVGHVSDRHAALYETVLAANRAGVAAVVPGATGHDVDDAATAVLEASPFAEHILTRTGHGLGREVHEDPYIMRGNHQVLEPGMVFTVEPGLYSPGDIGVRIEDDVLVGDDGAVCLTDAPRKIRIVG